MSHRKELLSLNHAILITCFLCACIESLVVIPERGNITFFNKKYFADAFANVRRYSRKSPYYINVWGTVLVTLANNVTMDVIFYEFLHNEYRRSFIELHYKLCDFFNKEPYIGAMFKNTKLECPVLPGCKKMMNMTTTAKNFPNVFPFKQGRAEATLSVPATNEKILQGYMVLTFKQ